MTNDVPALGLRPVHALLKDLDSRGMRLHSLLVHRHGRTVLDLWRWPHEPGLKHKMHSVTKSFTGTAVGFAEAEGLLRLDDPVLSFFPGRPAEPGSDLLSFMRIRDLLTMQTGHPRGLSGATTRLRTTGWADEFFEEPVVGLPGRHYQYNSTTSHVLSAVVQQATGEPVDAYLRPRLFEPLGITDFTWEHDPEGVASGGNGLSMLPRDLLAFGVLHLEDGVRAGRRVLPVGWVQKASALHVRKAVSGTYNGTEIVPPPPAGPEDEGYGFQFWTTPDGVYNASGIFGQECMVFPRHDAVVVTTGAMGDGTYHDLPGMLRKTFAEAFGDPAPDPGSAEAVREWQARAQEPEGWTDTTVCHAGLRRTYDFPENGQGLRSLSLDVRDDSVLVVIEDEQGRHGIEHGSGRWVRQRTGVSTWRLHHSYQEESALLLASAEWLDRRGNEAETLGLTWYFAESPFVDHLTVRIGEYDVSVERSVNINSGPTRLPSLRGTRRA
ncbi:serine hydrolase domain-containing protein [Streptomyces sp. NRRL F-5126]|uniref:serine hydrolase domain-containing protein n=1 Tax=Streptomyces sp. NRRL F-5126 TaxID=1463857 RepID=UPI00131C9AA0|nr:serine hydrolase [Streptomyces sp. NRRL F-5126]